jgi:hypothetical protein
VNFYRKSKCLGSLERYFIEKYSKNKKTQQQKFAILASSLILGYAGVHKYDLYKDDAHKD